jgi:two-component system response regulator
MRKQQLQVLLVEDSDNDADLFSLAATRSSARIKIEVVTDGEEAVRYLRRQNQFLAATVPDLILLDLNLPKKHGKEVLAEVKGDPQLKSIPVLVLTTSSAPDDIAYCYGAGAAGYLIKPDDFGELVKLIQKLSDFWILIDFPLAGSIV